MKKAMDKRMGLPKARAGARSVGSDCNARAACERRALGAFPALLRRGLANEAATHVLDVQRGRSDVQPAL